MTGVIVRSAANVQAGGKTRLSAILHGVWLLLFSVALVPVLRMIPTAALAGNTRVYGNSPDRLQGNDSSVEGKSHRSGNLLDYDDRDRCGGSADWCCDRDRAVRREACWLGFRNWMSTSRKTASRQ